MIENTIEYIEKKLNTLTKYIYVNYTYMQNYIYVYV